MYISIILRLVGNRKFEETQVSPDMFGTSSIKFILVSKHRYFSVCSHYVSHQLQVIVVYVSPKQIDSVL